MGSFSPSLVKVSITYTGSVAGANGDTTDSGTVVTGKTTDVHAGWPIQLGAVVTPAAFAGNYKQFTWTISGAGGNGSAAIAGYNPTAGSTYVAPLGSGSSTGTAFPGATQYYYYTESASETASVKPAGSDIPPAKTTFNVAKPTATLSTATDRVNVWSASGGLGFGGWMFQPQKDSGANGIDFTDSLGQNSGFRGTFNWIQVYAPDQSYWDTKGNLLDTVSGAGLDTLNRSTGGVFYGSNPPSDSPNTQPGVVAKGTVGKIVVADHATMWLMYKPAKSGSIWIPIADVPWNWGGTDSLANGSWGLTGGTWAKNPTGSVTNTFPTWGGYVNLTPAQAP